MVIGRLHRDNRNAHAFARLIGGILASAVMVTITVVVTGPAAAMAELPSGVPLVTLQLNLCNSGFASCYTQYNNGRSVPEARDVIVARRPDVVTLNEICRSDVVNSLYPAMVGNFPDSRAFGAFKAAGNRSTGQSYKCKNGDEYGIGILGRVRTADWAGVTITDGLYPMQDTSSNEMRAWVCAGAIGNYFACTTHLVSTSGTIALQQCKRLMDVEIPAFKTAVGVRAPVVVAGDLNLRYGGSPNVQSCVPPGYYRKGDGDVQHFMASTDLPFGYGQSVNLAYTDHDGWLVGVNP
jgi:hypothetical protein